MLNFTAKRSKTALGICKLNEKERVFVKGYLSMEIIVAIFKYFAASFKHFHYKIMFLGNVVK